jgi:predicted O-methyltransferase YrrM
MTMSIIWNDGNRFQINDIQFQFLGALTDLFTLKDEDGLTLGKWRRVIDAYLDTLCGMKSSHVLELGIFRGGSAAFFNELLEPEKLVAIDFMKKPTPSFQAYLQTAPNGHRVCPYFEVDQADTKTLQDICAREFGNEPLDLVIDDASHLLDKTRTSFNFLFPKVRPGGFYIIEDWSWAHMKDPDGAFQKTFGRHPPMSNLIIEIMLAAARRPDLIPEVRVFPSCAFVRKGFEPMEESFDITKECFDRGESTGGSDLFAR